MFKGKSRLEFKLSQQTSTDCKSSYWKI